MRPLYRIRYDDIPSDMEDIIEEFHLNIEAVAKLILTQSYKWVKGQSSWEHASDQQKEAAVIGANMVVAAALTPGDNE